MTYAFRPTETVASLFRRPATIARWDSLRRGRRPVGLAGTDAHARVGWKNQGDPYEDRTLLRLPSYESAFRAFSLQAVLESPLSGRAADDADALVRAIRAGHVHTIVDAYAAPGSFEFTGRTGGVARVTEGDATPLVDVLVLRVRTNAPAGSRLVLFRDGKEVHRVLARELVYATNRAGAYRAEAWLPGTGELPMPWAVSNAITAIDAQASPVPVAATPDGEVVATIDSGAGWSVERDPASSGNATAGQPTTTLDYGLGPAPHGSQFVALAHPVKLPAAAAAVAFKGVASAPMRVSVQLRVPKGRDGERWERSVYLDATPREVVVPLAEMRPAGTVSQAAPAIAAVDSLLLVVDRVHAHPGAAGRFGVSNVRILGAK